MDHPAVRRTPYPRIADTGRKVIFGIEQPLYQGIFLREVQALYKLNNCDNIVKIISHRNMVYTDASTKVKERVGCIFLEYISGETLAKTNISRLTSKQKFKIIKQLLSAIETAHYNGIIYRDINPNNIMIDDNGDVIVPFFLLAIECACGENSSVSDLQQK